MRIITSEGWQRIREGFSPEAPIGDPGKFWHWASRQGSGFQLAAYFILATADACADDFEGPAREAWSGARDNFSPMSLAGGLDETRKQVVCDFILNGHYLVH